MSRIKQLLAVVIFLSAIVILVIFMSKRQQMVTIFEGNTEKKPVPIILNHFQDSDCGMVIESIDYASQVVAPNGNTWFFHDHGGMVKWLANKPFKDDATIWVYGLDSKRWIDGKKAHYTRNEKTPMEYGFGAYEKNGTDRISFGEMELLTLRGETMANPIIRQKLLRKKDGND